MAERNEIKNNGKNNGSVNETQTELGKITQLILDDYKQERDIDNMDIFGMPERSEIVSIVGKLLHILFPGYYRDKTFKFYNLNNQISVIIEDVIYNLTQQVEIALEYDEEMREKKDQIAEKAQQIVMEYFKTIPHIRALVNTDIQATFDGDPAADNKEEIVLSYPGLLATTIYRLAHELELLKVPMIPRMMTEYAHGMTGIDIHPAATIGAYFFIDHGTGIVVGATSEIGEHVKIYQGVTIGALSTSLGHAMHGIKRHPTIEDNVTIYSGASILGGETVLGEGSVIGGNVFLTSSVPAGTTVTLKNPDLMFINCKTPENCGFDGCDKKCGIKE